MSCIPNLLQTVHKPGHASDAGQPICVLAHLLTFGLPSMSALLMRLLHQQMAQDHVCGVHAEW